MFTNIIYQNAKEKLMNNGDGLSKIIIFFKKYD